ncbi:PEGA domain protein [Chloroherpeton thalassium ATCC 35110]|uniref:PEGA domain protein n=1 Tax=Chloroherpeton thalassium (strain ATCC 35110 / GB-78) TaxID=517418 RepID=B3QX12_CHLT3|nr:PEGA domain-containing protein [Chloroherpeton thalassium]ACF14822.1 PEGA domain protein [Chloroherpeton thalassium ATCC 35110]
MKKILVLVVLLLLAVSTANAQLSVTSFKALPEDETAQIISPVFDMNGQKCALIKIVTSESNFAFEGGMLGITDVLKETGEYWVYVPQGSKKITIKHDKYGVLRNYIYPESIQSAAVYEMVLSTGSVSSSAGVLYEELKDDGVLLLVQTDPSDAAFYVDDTYIGKTAVQWKFKKQKYIYQLVKENYQSKVGVLDLTNIYENVTLQVELEPNFANIKVNTNPIDGAEVFLDGVNTGMITPCTLYEVSDGQHNLTIRHRYYKTVDMSITVEAGESQTVFVKMSPIFSQLMPINIMPMNHPIENRAYGNKEIRKVDKPNSDVKKTESKNPVKNDSHESRNVNPTTPAPQNPGGSGNNAPSNQRSGGGNMGGGARPGNGH